MVRWLTLTVLGMAALAASLSADTYHDAPDPAAKGGIVGKIVPAEGLQTVVAVEPTALKAYQATVDARTGAFGLRGLPPGEYDLLVKTVGTVYEGVTLEFDPDLAPKPEDLKAMGEGAGKTWFTLEDYFNIKKIVRLTGSAEKVRMFVVQTRTKPVLTPGAQKINAHIRRFDVVEMVKTNKVWQLASNRHLLRQEVPYNTPDSKIECVHLPKLGGVLVGDGVKDLGALDLTKLPRGDPKKYATAEHTAKE